MPLLSIVRFFLALISLAILGYAAFLLWEWYDGDLVLLPDGSTAQTRTDWYLWLGLALVGLSFLGRPLLTPLLARRDSDPTRPERADGAMVLGPNGTSLYVERLGPAEAPVVILTHGWAMDSTIWFYAKRALSRQFHVLAWDLPGMGRSKAPGGAIGLSQFAQDLRAVMDLVGERRVVLVGHSIGGMTIQTLARDEPDYFARKVAGVVLVNTTFTNPLKTMILSGVAQVIRWPLLEPLMRLAIVLQPLVWLGAWQSYLTGSAHLANRIGFGAYVTRSQLEHTTLLSTRNPPGQIQRGNLAMFRWDATGAMAKVDVPLLVLSGEGDIVTRPEAGKAIAASHTGSQYASIAGVNHMGFLERADVYNEAIERFATALRPY